METGSSLIPRSLQNDARSLTIKDWSAWIDEGVQIWLSQPVSKVIRAWCVKASGTTNAAEIRVTVPMTWNKRTWSKWKWSAKTGLLVPWDMNETDTLRLGCGGVVARHDEEHFIIWRFYLATTSFHISFRPSRVQKSVNMACQETCLWTGSMIVFCSFQDFSEKVEHCE